MFTSTSTGFAHGASSGMALRLNTLREVIGNTPLLVIDYVFRGRRGRVCAKAEHMNLSGSIKDRMALHILQRAYADGSLQTDDVIAEATSGNSGISLAAIGSALGHKVVIYMPDWMSRERVDLIRSYGAEVISISKEACVFLPRQFENDANVQAHAVNTGPEIFEQMMRANLTPQSFVAGVGTGGTVMGVSRALRQWIPELRVHPVEPAESPTLSTGHKVGSHRIQGISDEFIPEIVKLDELSPVIAVADGDSILMAQKLARTLGLAVGISSGCNFLAAVKAGVECSEMPVVATVFADDNKKYLTTGLMKDEPVHDGYLTPEIELLDLTILPRTQMHVRVH